LIVKVLVFAPHKEQSWVYFSPFPIGIHCAAWFCGHRPRRLGQRCAGKTERVFWVIMSITYSTGGYNTSKAAKICPFMPLAAYPKHRARAAAQREWFLTRRAQRATKDKKHLGQDMGKRATQGKTACAPVNVRLVY